MISDDANATGVTRLSASEVFLKHLTNEVNKDDVHEMIEVQQHMLSRFEKTNEMLLNFNGLSNSRYETTQREFRKNVQLLVDTKKDLDFIFRRIRVLKSRLSSQYPAAFAACAQVYRVPDDNEDEEGSEHVNVDSHDNRWATDASRNNVQVTVEYHATQDDSTASSTPGS